MLSPPRRRAASAMHRGSVPSCPSRTEAYQLKCIALIRKGCSRFSAYPELMDNMGVLAAVMPYDGSAYHYASPRLQNNFSIAVTAMAYYRPAQWSTPLHIRHCPPVEVAIRMPDADLRRRTFQAMAVDQSAKNQSEACKLIGPCLETTHAVARAAAAPLEVTDVSGETWSVPPSRWVGAKDAAALVAAFADQIEAPFELMIESPAGNFVPATAVELLTGHPEAMVVYL